MRKAIVFVVSLIFLFGCTPAQMIAKDQNYECPVPIPFPKPIEKPVVVEKAPIITPPVIEKKVEKKIEIIPFYFDFDRYNLRDQELAIEKALTALKENPEKKAELQGNCDNRGSVAYNMKLGMKRAETVKGILVKKGVEKNRLSTVSFGKSKATGDHPKDRRVDIVLK